MSLRFTVENSPRFGRLASQLQSGHPEFKERLREARAILEIDPYNQSHQYAIKKLTGGQAREGQWRLRLGRWRFRYNIEGQIVQLEYCGLRREDTY